MLKARSNRNFVKSLTALFLVGSVSVSASAQMDVTARQRVLDYLERQNSAQPNSDIVQQPKTIDPLPSEGVNPPDIINSGINNDSAEINSDAADFSIAPDDIIQTVPAPDMTDNGSLDGQSLDGQGLGSETAALDNMIAMSSDSNEELSLETESLDSEIIVTSPRSGLTVDERENSIVRDLSSTGALSARPGPESFGFFITARDYLAQRGQVPQPRLRLSYAVSRKNAKTAAAGESSTVDLIIGTDYAAISKTAGETVIYDFKEKRLLNVSKRDNTFTNASLYAAAYRSLDTVGKMTNGGKKRRLPLGAGVTLDAFYLESALGYAAGPNPSELSILQSGETLRAELGGKQIFSAAVDGPKLENFRQAYSFIGLLYHSEPVHPAILAELIEARAAPSAMTFHSYGPKIPEGEILSWTLTSKTAETAGFPLPAGAKSVVEGETVSPLGFVMSEAIAGRALGGRVDPRAALTVINQQLTRRDPLSAWVSAQSLKDSLGGCEQLAGLCRAISDAENQKSASSELTALIEGLSETKSKSTRIEGLSKLKPTLSAADAPSLVLRRAGLALAKTAPAEREAAGLSEFDPADLLTQAIARNPYDFLAYQGLAQLQAARGDFIQSWDINDALRAFSGVPQELRAPIDRAENQLSARAPGFFPPVER